MGTDPPKARAPGWLPFALLTLLFAVVVAGGARSYSVLRATITADAHRALIAIGDLKVGQIETWLEERRKDADVLTRNSPLARDVSDWRAAGQPDGALRGQIQSYLQGILDTYGYRNVVLFDARGERLFVAGRESPMAHHRDDVLRTVRERNVGLVDFHRRPGKENGSEIELGMMAPLRIAGKTGEEVDCVLYLAIDPSRFLYPLIQSWPTPDASGETLLAERRGEQALFLNDLRYREGTALTLTRSIFDLPYLPAAAAARGHRGIFEHGRDYRGVPVLSYIAEIPGTPWLMVSKVDDQAAFAELDRATLALVTMFTLVFSSGALIVLLWWHSMQARNRAALLKAEFDRRALIRHFDYLSKYANDIIVLTDGAGRVVEANDAAVQAYGHARETLVGMAMADLVAPAEREAFGAAQKAMRVGDGLCMESEHLRANGQGFPVEVGARFIETGGATYMQAIVRDISDRKRSERKLRQILDVSPVAVYSMPLPLGATPKNPNRQGFISESIGRLSGFSIQEWRADPALWLRRLHPEDRDRVCAGLAEVLEKGALTLEYRFLHRDGHYFWVRDSHVVMTDESGAPAELVGAWMDVTEHKQTEEQLRLFAQVFEFSREAILITDADTHILSVNRAFTGITGYSPDEVLGCNPALLASGLQAPEFYRAMWRELVGAGHWQGEIWNRRKNGEYYPEWLSISDVRDETGRITHYVGIFSDITEFKAAQDKIEYLARHDPLTHLPNRSLLDDRFAQAVARAVRTGAKLGLLFLDLDRFKAINDTLGHEIGDRLLQGIAQRLLICVRETDTVCRQGGDEFIIVLDDVSGADAVAGVANKILDVLQRPFEIGNHSLVTSFSIGIAIYPDDGADIATLMKKADTAMYHAKESGRNTYRFHTEQMNLAASTRMKLESALRRAVERREFQLHYQPQFDLADGALIGAEALLRWNSPEMGWIPPGEFIPIAEDSGLIVPMGEWVLREACRQAVAWREQGLSGCSVAVNLSALQFKRGQVVEMVGAALRETGLEPACLELELTESILLQDAAGVMESLRRLKGMGVKLSIDDLGTGYSSLGYLRRLEMDQLKIDKSFVRDLPDNAEGAALVRAIIQMAHALSLATIAEGVETAEQLNHLRSEGCGAAQGFYLARPMPSAEFVQRYIPVGARVCG